MLLKHIARSAVLALLPVLIACGTTGPRTATGPTAPPTAPPAAAEPTAPPTAPPATAAPPPATPPAAPPTPVPEIGSAAWYRQLVLSPTLRLEGEHPGGLRAVLDGQTAYVLDVAPGAYPAPTAKTQLSVLDVSRPDAPQQRGSVAVPTASGLAYAAPLVWLATGTGLLALDVSDPRNITTRATFATINATTSVQLAGGRAYVTTVAPNKNSLGELLIVDIGDLDNLRPLGRVEISPEVTGVAVAGERAYVVDSLRGMQVLDISDPATPQPLGSYQTDQARGIALEGDRVYLATGRGLEVVDVADVAKPVLLGLYRTPFYALDVQLAQGRAYLTFGNIGSSDSGGMVVVDVRDPRQPALLAQALLPAANAGAVEVANGLVALTSSRHGLLLLQEVSGK